MPLDEKSLRKPAFDEATSAPISLADGQDWLLPKPWLEVRPIFRGGRSVDTLPVMTCGPEFDGLKQAVQDAEGDAVIAAGATLAAHMLLTNYALNDDQLSSLLAFRDGSTWIRDVMGLASG